MPPTLRDYFLVGHRPIYAQKFVTAAADDECMICKHPYSTGNTTDCRAIRWRKCGHIIGDKCFRTWIRRRPETCPYWNHILPQMSKPVMSSLGWICNTAWFALTEDFVLSSNDGAHDTDLNDSLRNLHRNRLTASDAFTILSLCLLMSIVTTLVFGALLIGAGIAFWIVVKLSYTITTMFIVEVSPMWASVPLFFFNLTGLDIHVVIGVINNIAFMGVVTAVIILGLRRSKVQRTRETFQLA